MGVVADYRFSTVDYASTVPVRDRKFLSDRTTFESAFGDAKFGVLYAYWRHEDKTEPTRRLTDTKRKIVYLAEPEYFDAAQVGGKEPKNHEMTDKKREANTNEIWVSQYFDESDHVDEPE